MQVMKILLKTASMYLDGFKKKNGTKIVKIKTKDDVAAEKAKLASEVRKNY